MYTRAYNLLIHSVYTTLCNITWFSTLKITRVLRLFRVLQEKSHSDCGHSLKHRIDIEHVEHMFQC